jgi:MoaA/NifB/PqqE/SkfB family radical SAM enzyme
VGVLISGGCRSDGSVPIDKFIDSIKMIKKETNLIINTHTGLLDEITAKKLADAGVDLISLDINMDEEIINEIYHLDKNLSEYEKAIKILKKYDLNVVPHICVGLHYGILHKELDSIKLSWSNGIRSWLMKDDPKIEKGEEVRLDANEIIVPVSPLRMDRIICYLNDLPLYSASIEAQERGEFSRKEALAVWLKGQPDIESDLYKRLQEQYFDILEKE